MVVLTRATARRRSVFPDPTRQQSDNATSITSMPVLERRQAHKRKHARSADSPHTLPEDGPQVQKAQSRTSDPLTWQQVELLHTAKSHRRTRSHHDQNLASPQLLPTLRVTSAGDLIAADLGLPVLRGARDRIKRKSVDAQNVTQRNVNASAACSKSRRLSSTRNSSHRPASPVQGGRASKSQDKAFAGPSFFRSPPPQALPLPTFTRLPVSTMSVTA